MFVLKVIGCTELHKGDEFEQALSISARVPVGTTWRVWR